jgi:hypothetical protein
MKEVNDLWLQIDSKKPFLALIVKAKASLLILPKFKPKMCFFVELLNDSVFLVGISWYFLGILPTNTKGKLGWYISVSKN